MKKNVLLFALTLVSFCTSAQAPKREMRAGWLATVYRIDWPTTTMTSVTPAKIQAQKDELVTILDSVKAANMNAVFFQARPESDAFYHSAYEPWSAHLGGVRGADPGYDPLAYAIEQAHNRGLELHVWLNPYRYETSAGKYTGLPGDYKTAHPEWILDYAVYSGTTKTTDGITILDPGNPAVRKLIKNVVGDILSKYDIDGAIFDDYFYAYAGTNSTLDSYSQNLYKPSNMTLSNWRRQNVNQMIADVYDTIQAVKPQVVFGVSPFGIWTTQSSVATAHGLTLPSGITGSNMYEQIYCDPVAWLEQGKVDYISPQLYWTTTSSGQDYDVLCPWWSSVANKYSRYFYSSMSVSALASTYAAPAYSSKMLDDAVPDNLSSIKQLVKTDNLYAGLSRAEKSIVATSTFADSEVGLQIDRNRTSTLNAAPGAVLYSIKNVSTKGKFAKYLREQKFTSPSLTPAISWKTHPTLAAPTNVRIVDKTLCWDYSTEDVRFAVYTVPNASVGTSAAFTTVTNLLGVAYAKKFDISKYTALISSRKFAVSALDRYGNEFTANYVVTSTEVPELRTLIRTTANGIEFDLEQTSIVELFTSNGMLLTKGNMIGTCRINVPRGFYIVRINGKTQKLVF